VLFLIAACSSKDAAPPDPTIRPEAASGSGSAPAPVLTPVPPAPVDAGVVPSDGITEIGTFDAASGMHLDDDATNPGHVTPPPRTVHTGKAIDIMLKSTPPGAMAAVDGVQMGPTPTYWPAGEADGREHEFTFVLRGFAVARYRFVPISSGVVHARLEAIVEDRPDAGVP